MLKETVFGKMGLIRVYIFQISITLVVLWFAGVQSCSSDHYSHNGRCCKKCPSGTHVKFHCSAQRNKTVCQRCQSGTFTDNDNNRTAGCLPCRRQQCSPSFVTIQNCTATTNFECGCSPNEFHNGVTDSCSDCRVCSRGTYLQKPCSQYEDARCEDCPENYYSNKTNNKNDKCDECTTCKRYKRKCNSTHDALCDDDIASTTVGSPTLKIWSTLASTTTTETTRERKNEEAISETTIILISVVAIMCLAILCFIFTCKRKKLFCDRGVRFIAIEESRYDTMTLQTGLLLRDQPASLLLGMAKLLNGDNRPNWKDLAPELQFVYSDISNFEVDRKTSSERMLASWQTKDSSTIDVLYEALRRVQRDDVVTYLLNNYEKHCESLV